ncbi:MULTISPECIES: gliding motility-associated C-terminal domain-containing protein [Sphingobacterium]|uniref:gliding motility-associated C-terminal domain-containing protein n=1 Tax=Sphingobacterium TaxID=28453 RepID=UPI0013DD6503|nr:MULTISPECIES: gliding motility-associated C-terminal domain-containing protein [unclassified Sphingobacterium]
MKKLVFLCSSLLFVLNLYGQQGAGSSLYSNGNTILTSNQFKAIYTESLFIGENAEWRIDGQIDLYVKNIWIAPTAKVSGQGVINIHSPEKNPFYNNWGAQPTRIDANGGNAVDIDLVVLNNKGLQLANIAESPEIRKPVTVTEQRAGLRLSRGIDLAVDGAHIFLDGNDLELGEEASIRNYNHKRFVVTNNPLAGHLIKAFGNRRSAFLFPVGKQIGDYTPASLTPSLKRNKVYVAVTDYLASGLKFKDKEIGMDRVWNIFSDKPMIMDYTLIHQVSSNGVAFVDPEAQIMQDAEGGNWIGNVTNLESLDRNATHTRKDVETKSSKTLSGTWFTKIATAPPQAKLDHAIIVFGQSRVVQVLDNDKPGSSPILANSIEIIEPPQHARAYVENGAIVCVGNDDYLGNDVLEYKITDKNGLTATAKVYMKIIPRDLYIPNVFTPNSDGKNDNYVILGLEAYDRVELIIVDRFGKELFRADSYTNEWTGEGLKEGTYFYNVTAFKGGDSRLYKGSVLLKRE